MDRILWLVNKVGRYDTAPTTMLQTRENVRYSLGRTYTRY